MSCPSCAKGALFDGLLSVRSKCPNCGEDFSSLDTGDGPAVFVMFFVSVLVIVPAFFLELAMQPPYWVFAVIFVPLIIILPLILLRPFKALMFAMQYRYKAHEMLSEERQSEEGEER